MAIIERTRMYEIMVRFNVVDGVEQVAAKQHRITELVDDATDVVRSAVVGDAEPLAMEDVVDAVGEFLPTLTAQVADLQSQLAASQAATAEAEAATTAVQASLDEKQAQLDAMTAERDALAEQVAALTATPEVVRVSRMQARLALKRAGLLSTVETAIAQVAAADPDSELPEYWAGASYFHRDHPMIAAVGAVLGLTEAQIDELFASALAIA